MDCNAYSAGALQPLAIDLLSLCLSSSQSHMSAAKNAEGAQVSAYGGGTGIAVPLPLQSLGLPGYLELGFLYKVWCLMVGRSGLNFHSSLLSFCLVLMGSPT